MVASVSLAVGDTSSARVHLKQGMAHLAKGRTDAAIRSFEEARKEDPDLAEPVYWIGAAQDKKGDAGAARAAFRAFRSMLRKQGGLPAPAAPEADLWKKASKRLLALAPGEAELDRAHEAFAAKALAAAKAQTDPAAAIRILQLARRLEPLHARTRSALEALVPPEAAASASGNPFERVVTWTDILAERRFGSGSAEILAAGDGALTFDSKTPMHAQFLVALNTGTRWVMDLEARVAEAHVAIWKFGLWVGGEQPGALMFRFWQRQLELGVLEETTIRTLATGRIEPVQPTAWHRFGVVADGHQIELWWDGKSVVKTTLGPKTIVDGPVGVQFEGARVEVRVFRYGTWE